MRIGLFGGSFDPIHLGHVEAARRAREALALDRVLLLPTARPPHKPDRRFAPALARYAMVELALLDDAALFASDLELSGERPAYTIETVEHLRRARPGDELVLLVGSDSLAELDGWRRWRDLLEAVEVGVLARPGWERERIAEEVAPELAAALAAAPPTWLPELAHPASATEIRRRIGAGEALPEGWLDPRVLRFVKKYALYR